MRSETRVCLKTLARRFWMRKERLQRGRVALFTVFREPSARAVRSQKSPFVQTAVRLVPKQTSNPVMQFALLFFFFSPRPGSTVQTRLLLAAGTVVYHHTHGSTTCLRLRRAHDPLLLAVRTCRCFERQCVVERGNSQAGRGDREESLVCPTSDRKPEG